MSTLIFGIVCFGAVAVFIIGAEIRMAREREESERRRELQTRLEVPLHPLKDSLLKSLRRDWR